MSDVILFEQKGAVAIITINKPKANQLSHEVFEGMRKQIDMIEMNRDIKAVVITGSGDKIFSAGADLSSGFGDFGPVDFLKRGQDVWNKVEDCGKPVIAALNGHALGGGCELALACDLVVAGTNAQFGQPEVNLGMIPGAGGASRLVRTCGKALAMQMVLTGRPIDARTALAAGIAVEVDEPESALARAIELAAVIASKPPVAIRLAKEAVRRALEVPLTDAVEADRQAFALLAASDDRREGIAAFLEKRPPTFTGR